MLSFNTAGIGSIGPLGLYPGYLLAGSGNFWLGMLFLAVTVLCSVLCLCALCRFIINYRRAAA